MTDFDLMQQLAAQRRQQFAQQAQFQAPQGQMVGGHFVAPNVLQQLAAGLRSVGGMRGQQLAEQELQNISRQRTEGTQKAMADFLRQSQGTPENAPGDGMGPVMPAQAPNMQGAYSALLQAPDAGLRQAGMQGVMQTAQQQAQTQQAGIDRDRNMRILQSSTPQEAIAAGLPVDVVRAYHESRNFGRDEVQFQDVGGQLVPVTRFGDRPEGVAPIDKTGNPFSDMLVRDAQGRIVPNAPLVGARTAIAQAGRPQVTVDARNFNTQESEQSKVFGRGLGEARVALMNAGIEAPRRLAQMERMEGLLEGIEGGRLAPAMADVASALNSVGISIDRNLGPKEAAEALAVEMALKMRPPGSGPMTDKDFDNFMRTVPGLARTAEGRREIMQTVRAAVQRDIEAAQFAREYAEQNNGVIDDRFFQALQNFYIQNPVVTPPVPPTNSRGQPTGPRRQAAPDTAPLPDDISQILQMYLTDGAR